MGVSRQERQERGQHRAAEGKPVALLCTSWLSISHLEILGGVSCQLQHLSSQVLCETGGASDVMALHNNDIQARALPLPEPPGGQFSGIKRKTYPGWQLCTRQRWHQHGHWLSREPAGRSGPAGGCEALQGAVCMPVRSRGPAAGPARRAMRHTHLEQTVDAPHRELQAGPCRPGRGLLLVALLVTHGALGTLARQALGSLSRHGCSAQQQGGSEGGGGLAGA